MTVINSEASTKPSVESEQMTHRQILTILAGLMLGIFLAALDQTIVSTAIRRIGDDLHGLSVQAWVTTAFLITSTLTTPLYGKLSDIYGRKPFFLLAITIFITGSALCGLATNMYMLAGFRAFQGVGAGGLASLALAIMADILSPQQRPKYMGYFMGVFATSSVLGPVVGGFLSGQGSILGVVGWRWIFYVNVPIGLIALVVVTKFLRLPPRRNPQRIDWLGAALLIVGLVPLLIVAEQGRTWGWGSPAALSCYLIGVIGILAWIAVERRMGEAALIPMRLFHNRVFGFGSGFSLVIGAGMFGGLGALPLYLQIVKGASPTAAGLLMLPLVVGMMSASMLAGFATSRTGRYRKYPIIGSLLLVSAMALMATLRAETSLFEVDIYMLVFGVGLGLSMQTIQLAMQNSVSPKDIGVATSSGTFFRAMGGTLGTAVFLSILFSVAPSKISDAYSKASSTASFQQAAASHPDQISTVRHASGSLNDTAFVSGLDKTIAHPFLQGFSSSVDVVFIAGAAVLVIAFLFSLMLEEIPLRTTSGIDASRAEDEEQLLLA
jgi:EmrB/QacA subfamily drug resistance transporter